MYTINDVAKLSGVSIATVSNAINKNGKVARKTEEKVLAAIKELNYIPNNLAKGLKTNKLKNIGILAEDIGGFSSPDIIDGICEYSEHHDYTVSLCNLRVNQKVGQETVIHYEELESSESFQHNVATNLNQLLTSRVNGLIYIGVHPRDVGNLLPNINIPTTYTYAYTTKEDYCINYNDYQGAKIAVEYLIQQNHRKIAVISGSINSIPAHKRLLGYQTTLMEHGLPFIPEYVRTGNWHYEDGYSQCSELLNLSNAPTAIFAMSDLMALGALNAAMDRGLKIPDDLSIHGFDNIDLSQYTRPALTTIGLPLKELGIETAKTLINVIEHKEIPKKDYLIDCVHIPRSTVKKLI